VTEPESFRRRQAATVVAHLSDFNPELRTHGFGDDQSDQWSVAVRVPDSAEDLIVMAQDLLLCVEPHSHGEPLFPISPEVLAAVRQAIEQTEVAFRQICDERKPAGEDFMGDCIDPAASIDMRRSDTPESQARIVVTNPADIPRMPIPMILTCPCCGARHVDRGEYATKPHHTHACQSCGICWRPAVQPTVGVQFLPGFKDDP